MPKHRLMTFACECGGECEPCRSALVAAAIATHHTATSEGAWDAGAQLKKLDSGNDGDATELKLMHAWVDPSKDENTKGAYKLPHHNVSDGKVGAAVHAGVSAAVGALNGARGGADIPEADKKGVYNHLIAHLKDAGVADADLPELDGSSIDDLLALDALISDGMPSVIIEQIPVSEIESTWHAYLFVEGLQTSDGRASEMGAGIWRDLPLPLAWAKHNEGGHYGSSVVGAIETIELQAQDGYNLLYATGTWDLGNEHAAECARQVQAQGGTRFVSADIEPLESEWVSMGTDRGDDSDILDMLFGDQDGYECLTSYRVCGATVVATPAFPQCVIAPLSVPLPIVEPMPVAAPEPEPQPMLVASAAIAAKPNRAWFDNPSLSAPTAITVRDGGEIVGHIAAWGTCHTASPQGPGVCTQPPHSRAGYAYFLTGEVECESGERVSVGQLTMGCGHPSLRMSAREAMAHYDGGPGALQMADVQIGEDEHGIWVHGAMRPGITDEQLRAFTAQAPSGDWREIGGSLELVAAVQVPVPGFPVPRSLAASAGVENVTPMRASARIKHLGDERRVVALVAAGRVVRIDPMAELQRRVEKIEQLVAPLGDRALADLDSLIDA